MGRFNLEFGLIFKKRLYELRYGYGSYLSNGIASVIFTILTGVISILIYKSWNQSSQYTFQQTDYQSGRGTHFAIAFNPNDQKYDQKLDIVGKIETATGLKGQTFKDKADLESGLFKSSGDQFSFAIYIDAFWPSLPNPPSPNPDMAVNATLYYNLSQYAEGGSYEMTKTHLGVLLTRVLYSGLGTDSSLDIIYEPLNGGFEISQLWAYFGPLLVSFAVLNIGSALGLQLVEDRENYRLHSMLTSGLHQWIYWFANWVFDLLIYLIYVIIDWLILLAFGTAAIVDNNWMATFFLLVFTTVQTLPLVYLISVCFDKLQSINAFLQNILMVTTLIPYFIVTLVLKGEISELGALILAIIPSYSVQYGLDVCARRAVGQPLTAKEVWTGKMVKVYAVQIGSGILFALLTALVNYIKNRTRGRKLKDTDEEEVVLDEDVQEIAREVASGSHDGEAIVIKNLDKVYVDSNGHAFKAVNNVSLYVKKGEMFGVLGANGAGKSTLMAVITGRTNASSGEISILGHPIYTGDDAKEYVSICPQFDNHLFPCLTPRQHFEIYGKLKGYSGEELKAQIEEYERILSLEKHGNKLIRQLSGGNARKLSIALAFLGHSPIVFLDEPTASLDPVARLQTQELVEQKADGRTVLLCTHLLSEAEKLCNRICIMLSGRVHAIGTHQHLSEKFGTKWKVELGLVSDSAEAREAADRFMQENLPGSELAGTRFAAATYNVPKGDRQLSEIFILLNENKSKEHGYTYFTCSMSTLERVFIDLVLQAES